MIDCVCEWVCVWAVRCERTHFILLEDTITEKLFFIFFFVSLRFVSIYFWCCTRQKCETWRYAIERESEWACQRESERKVQVIVVTRELREEWSGKKCVSVEWWSERSDVRRFRMKWKREMKSIRLNKCCRMSIWIVCVLCADHGDPHREFNLIFFFFSSSNWNGKNTICAPNSDHALPRRSDWTLSYTTWWANIYQRIFTCRRTLACQMPIIKFCLLLTNAVRSIDSRIQLFLTSICFWLVSIRSTAAAHE